MQSVLREQLIPLARQVGPEPEQAPARAALCASTVLGLALTRYVGERGARPRGDRGLARTHDPAVSHRTHALKNGAPVWPPRPDRQPLTPEQQNARLKPGTAGREAGRNLQARVNGRPIASRGAGANPPHVQTLLRPNLRETPVGDGVFHAAPCGHSTAGPGHLRGRR
jgi:hypothetical protein